MSPSPVVLFIEDQVGFRMVYGDVLCHGGYRVEMAVDGEEGWGSCKRIKPDLVLLDLGLPKLDGLGVLELIRHDPETKNIPVIIFSVMGEQQKVEMARQLGANDYVIKGFVTPFQVLKRVRCQLMDLRPLTVLVDKKSEP
jgi:CheY-like chemotaxis protein